MLYQWCVQIVSLYNLWLRFYKVFPFWHRKFKILDTKTVPTISKVTISIITLLLNMTTGTSLQRAHILGEALRVYFVRHIDFFEIKLYTSLDERVHIYGCVLLGMLLSLYMVVSS